MKINKAYTNRRHFLKTAIAAAAISTATIVLPGNYIDDYFFITINGDIKYTGPHNCSTFTVLEFHEWICDNIDYLNRIHLPQLSTRITNNIIEIHGDCKIDKKIMRHLDNGCIVQLENVWSSDITYKI